MNKLFLGLVVFFGIHSISLVALGWRNRIAGRLGTSAWRRLYSIAAAIGLFLLISGYGAARHSARILYVTPASCRYLAVLLMLPTFTLVLAAVLPGRLSARARHPLLVATLLWSAAHLLTNGSIADVWLFGSFLVWAAAVLASFAFRPARPPIALPAATPNDAIALIGGLAAYAIVLFWLHARLFGVAPLGA